MTRERIVSYLVFVLMLFTSFSNLFLVTNVSADGSFTNTDNLGYEFLDDGSVFHMWNSQDSYFFNRSNGIQFSNHYLEYWSTNVLMLGYYNNGVWNLIYRVDELSGFNEILDAVTEDYINVTLWKDLSYGSYDFRLALRYHLKVNDSDLTVIPYIKNLGVAIPFDIGFGWELKDINIANNQENDYFRLRDNASDITNTVYSLHNDSLDESYTNLTFWWTDDNQEWTNWEYSPEFHLDNHRVNGEKDQTLYLKWDENLDYKVVVKSRVGQYNAPVTLFVKVGTLSVGQEKSTELSWYDAYIGVGSEYTFLSSAVAYIATAPINETDFLLAFMDDGVGDAGKVCVGRVASDGTISFGTSVEFGTDVGIGLGLDICIVNDATNRFMIAYTDDDQADDGYVYTSTFSEMVIDTGSDAWIEYDTTDSEHSAICKIRDDYAVVCYNDEGNSDTGQAVVVWWDSGLNVGTAVEIDVNYNGNDLDPFYTDCVQLGTDKFAVTLIDTEAAPDDTLTYVGSVSGTTITMGGNAVDPGDTAPLQGASASSTSDEVFVCSISADDFYHSYSSVSGTTITQDQTSQDTANSGDRFMDVDYLDSNTFVVAYADDDNGDIGKMFIINASTSSIGSPSATTTFNNGATSGGIGDVGISVCRLTDTYWIVAFQDDADNDYGKCVLGYTDFPPSQSSPVPTDDATEQSINPSMSITVDDIQDDSLIGYWYDNNSGSWKLYAYNLSIDTSSGAVTIIQNNVMNGYNIGTETTDERNMLDGFRGIKINATTNGSVNSIWLRLGGLDSWENGENVKGLIYDSGLNLIGTTEIKSHGGSTAYYQFNFTGTKPTVVKDNIYYIGGIADSAVGLVREDAVSETTYYGGYYGEVMTYGSPEDPIGSWDVTDSTKTMDAYIVIDHDNFNSYNKKYWWSMNVTDGTYWSNSTYSFTTEMMIPEIEIVTPQNGSTGVSTSPTVEIKPWDNGTNAESLTVEWWDNATGGNLTSTFISGDNDDYYNILAGASGLENIIGDSVRSPNVQDISVDSITIKTHSIWGQTINVQCAIYEFADASGPDYATNLVATSETKEIASGTTDTEVVFNFSSPSLDTYTYYWFCVSPVGDYGTGISCSVFTDGTMGGLIKSSTSGVSFSDPLTSETDGYGPYMLISYTYYDSDAFTLQQTNTSVTSGDTAEWTYTNASSASTQYWWKTIVNNTQKTNGSDDWYSFTTASAGNTAPTQSGESPTNTSTDISLTPQLYVICSDSDASDTLNATWWSNSSGAWVQFGSNETSFSSGTNITQPNSNFSANSQTYWWSVNLTDGTDWNNETYHFTTESAEFIWIDITNASWALGNIIMGASTYTNETSKTFIADMDNTTVATDLKLQVTSDGADWTAATAGNSAGADTYRLNASIDTWNAENQIVTASATTISSNIPASQNETFDLRFDAPTASTTGTEQTITTTASLVKH